MSDLPESKLPEPLTEGQIEFICKCQWSGGWNKQAMIEFARRIESAHGIGVRKPMRPPEDA
jgi:hypothetical protein